MNVLRSIYHALNRRYTIAPFIERNLTKKDVPRTLGWGGCFGGLAFLVFLIQVYTGVLLLIYYKPDPANAWDSVDTVQDNPLGAAATTLTVADVDGADGWGNAAYRTRLQKL